MNSSYPYFSQQVRYKKAGLSGNDIQRPEHWNEKERSDYEELCRLGFNNSLFVRDHSDFEDLKVNS